MRRHILALRGNPLSLSDLRPGNNVLERGTLDGNGDFHATQIIAR